MSFSDTLYFHSSTCTIQQAELSNNFVYVHESIDMFLLMWIPIHKGTECQTSVRLIICCFQREITQQNRAYTLKRIFANMNLILRAQRILQITTVALKDRIAD